MKPRSNFPQLLSAIALIGAAVFALDRYLDLCDARDSRIERQDQVNESQRLLKAHPEAFVASSNRPGAIDLKALVQESSARNGVSLIYLSENERQVTEKVRERCVQARGVNVPHANFVAFLADLETRGGGARIKEIRLKPALDRSEVYVEAESSLALRMPIEDSLSNKPVGDH